VLRNHSPLPVRLIEGVVPLTPGAAGEGGMLGTGDGDVVAPSLEIISWMAASRESTREDICVTAVQLIHEYRHTRVEQRTLFEHLIGHSIKVCIQLFKQCFNLAQKLFSHKNLSQNVAGVQRP
jgi:hypothetical protein